MYDVIIAGGGIVGTAIAYVMSFTNLRVLLLEKYAEVATVNSNTTQNAQSLHGGAEETNFTIEKVLVMRECEMMLSAFLEKFARGAFIHLPKMALAVGEDEVSRLTQRFQDLKAYFPTLELLDRNQILQREPALVIGRDPRIPMAALGRQNGKAVDYHRTAKAFEQETLDRTKNTGQIEFKFGTKVEKVIKHDDHYEFITNQGTYRSKIFIAASGPYSLKYSQDLGARDKSGALAKDFVTLPVGGDFNMISREKYPINSKVYPMQDPKFPFARPHIDPAIHDPLILRLGPTALWLPMWERYHWESFFDYIRSGILTTRGVVSSFALLSDWDMVKFMSRNIGYKLPIYGKRSFLNSAALHIVPTLKLEDLTFLPGDGGLRPQPLNTKTGKLQMGTGKFFAENFIGNLTPSPGASSSLRNAVIDTLYAVRWIGPGYFFDPMALYETIGLKEYPSISIDK